MNGKKRYIILTVLVAMLALFTFGCKKKTKKPVVIGVDNVIFKYDEGLNEVD